MPQASRRTCRRLATASFVVWATVGCVAPDQAPDDADLWYSSGARIYRDPFSPPIEGAVVVVRGGTIEAVGAAGEVDIPAGARAAACSGEVLVAGFQNSHVHFMGEEWTEAGDRPATELSRSLRTMLTQYGYTSVVDIGSDLHNTLALRERIESGEIPGPRLLVAASPLFPHQGLPSYLSDLPQALRSSMLQPANPREAVNMVRANLDAGADATKLFLVTPQTSGPPKRMDAGIAQAAAHETHARGRLVFAHPTDVDGVRAALDAAVDVLAHTTLGTQTPWPDELVTEVIAADLAMIPTLKLLGYELEKEGVPDEIAPRIIDASVAQVRAFADAGGVILFGTDVGYMTDFDPRAEYELLAAAGLSTSQILASLTTTPAGVFGESRQRGRLSAGMGADIVALAADPAQDPANFASVACVYRGGELIYDASQ